MQKYISKIIIGFLLISGCCFTGLAQDTGYIEEITIIAPYRPTITEARKVTLAPRIPSSDYEKPDFNYSINPQPLNVPYTPEDIKPARVVGEPLNKLYRNFIKAGFGNYKTPYIEFFANSLRSRKHSLGIHAKHLSSGDMKDYKSSRSENELNLSVTRFYKHHSLSGTVDFERDVVHHYGLETSIPEGIDVSKDALKQIYYQIGTDFSYSSHFVDQKKLNHIFRAGYNYLFDHYDMKEHHGELDIDLNKNFDIIRMTDSDELGMSVHFDIYRNADSLRKSTASVLSIAPYFETSFDEYSICAGFNGTLRMDSLTQFHFYPKVEGKVTIIDNTLIAFLGMKGNFKRNSMEEMNEENPFIISTLPLEYINNRFEIYGGINSRIGRNLDFMLQLDGASINNRPFFVNDTSTFRNKTLFNQFTVVYDNIRRIHGKAEFIYQLGTRYRIVLEGDFYQYTMNTEKEAWHTPEYKVALSGKYNLRDKFIIKGEVTLYGKSYAKTYVNDAVVPEELNAFVDINAGLEYRYSKRLSGFVNLNNLANARYYRWNNYISYGFNFLAGLSYSF